MSILTTAARLNVMIREHVDTRPHGERVPHGSVYLQPETRNGCNWNIAVNCNADAMSCSATISTYLDDLRVHYVIPPDDATAIRS